MRCIRSSERSYFTHSTGRAELKMHKFLIQCFAASEPGEQSSSTCIWEIQIWSKKNMIRALHYHYQGSAGLKAVFIPCMDAGPSSLLMALLMLIEYPLQITKGVILAHSLSFYLCFSFNSFFTFFFLSHPLPFLTEVRAKEKGILERAGVVQSLTVGVAPIVVVIASVCTFTLHMALGYDLTAAQVFFHEELYTTCQLHMSVFTGDI